MDMQVRLMSRCTRVGQLLHSSVSDPLTLPDDDYVFGINAGVPIVGLFVVAFFAYLEIVYMDMQVRLMSRCTRVGQLLHSSVSDPLTLPDDDYVFGIKAAFGKDPFRWASVPSILATRPELYMFYLGLMAAMILSGVLIWMIR
jgi:hypothetical protein